MFTFDVLYGAKVPGLFQNQGPKHLPSLVDCSSAVIAASWPLMKTCLRVIPRDLFDILLRDSCRALLEYKPGAPELCLTKMVQRWPASVLKLNPGRHPLEIDKSKKSFELIMHVLAGAMKLERMSKLRVLDLSDIPMKSDTCILILQNITASKYKKVDTVIMDLSIDEENYGPVECQLTNEGFGRHRYVNIKCRRLIMTSLGALRVTKTMNLVESKGVVGLNVDLNRLENRGFLMFLSSLMRFTDLQALTLTYNLIDVTKDRKVVQEVVCAFSELKQLRRLNLGHNILTGSLRELLEALALTLESLHVCECKLSASDLAYFANSRHVETIVELEIGSNNLSVEKGRILEKLLTNSGRTLRFLGMDSGHLNRVSSSVWMRVIPHFRRLVAVMMRSNGFTARSQISLLRTLANTAKKLTYVGVSLVYDPLDMEVSNFWDDSWEEGNDRVHLFFQLYYANGQPLESSSKEEKRGRNRSLTVHDVDEVTTRDAFIFLHHLESENDNVQEI